MKVIFTGTDAEIMALCARIGAIAATGERPAVERIATLPRKLSGFDEAVAVLDKGGCVSNGLSPASIIWAQRDGDLCEEYKGGWLARDKDLFEFYGPKGHCLSWFEVADPTEVK